MLCLIVFCNQITHVCHCLILQVVGGATFSFWAAYGHVEFFVFGLQTFLDVYYLTFNLLYLVVGNLLGVSGSFRTCFFFAM